MARKLLILICILFLAHCGPLIYDWEGSGDDSSSWVLALLGGDSSSEVPAPLEVCDLPTIEVPAPFTRDDFTVESSSLEVPGRVNGNAVPVSAIREVKLRPKGDVVLSPEDHIFFPDDTAILTFRCDGDKIRESGLSNEFHVYYFDRGLNTWKNVESVTANLQEGSVTARVRHFTPFILAAVPPTAANVPPPPACIASDFPNGVGGSGRARFFTVDRYFKYYQDRDYYIEPGGDFDALGFSQALGISTCNGGGPGCQSENQHKHFDGTDYIRFTAHTDIDLYLMYDSRGGSGPGDLTQDADWIAAKGFEDTGKFIETTDGVGKYTVYKRSYDKGDEVRLDGNRYGTSSNAINTNYWVVIKRKGMRFAQPAHTLCESNRPSNPPVRVSGLRAIPGADQVILHWRNPDDPDFEGTVIRRSTVVAPATRNEGSAVTGSYEGSSSYVDMGLQTNQLYHYTVFALDKNTDSGTGVSVSVRTGPDLDGDGLADSYEISTFYPTGQTSQVDNTDTDGDGIKDGDEVAQGTDPTNPDNGPPVISAFTLLSDQDTTNPIAQLQIEGSDDTGITGWTVTQDSSPPDPESPYWRLEKPTSYQFDTRGEYELYAWAKDRSGNVSAGVEPVTVNLRGVAQAKMIYVTARSMAGGEVVNLAVDERDHSLSLGTAISFVGAPGPLLIAPAISSAFLYKNMGTELYRLGFDSENGVVGPPEPMGLAIFSDFLADVGISPDNHAVLIGNNDGVLWLSLDDAGNSISVTNIKPSDGPFLRPYDIVFHQNGRFIYSVNINSGNLGLFRRSPITGSIDYDRLLSTGNGHPASIAIHPNGQILVYLDYALDSLYSYSIDPNTGGLQLLDILSGPQKPHSAVFHPSGRFLYVAEVGTDVSRPGHVGVYSINPADGEIRLIQRLETGRHPFSVVITPDGHTLYATGLKQPIVYQYIIDSNSGKLRLQSEFQIPDVEGIHDLDIYSESDGNDPPIANAGQDRNVKTGQEVQLFGQLSYDPDASRCNANSANYVYQWNIIEKPAGSSATIRNSNSLTGSEFTPDVDGQYKIELSFTDAPGTCDGKAATGTDTVTFAASVNPPPPEDPPPYPEPPPTLESPGSLYRIQNTRIGAPCLAPVFPAVGHEPERDGMSTCEYETLRIRTDAMGREIYDLRLIAPPGADYFEFGTQTYPVEVGLGTRLYYKQFTWWTAFTWCHDYTYRSFFESWRSCPPIPGLYVWGFWRTDYRRYSRVIHYYKRELVPIESPE